MGIEIIKMPHLGESVTEASITSWLVEEGDTVQRFDPIAEAVSDKVTTEIPSDFNGVIKRFLIELDEDVPIGTPMIEIEVEGAGSGEATEPESPQQAVAEVVDDVPQEAATPIQDEVKVSSKTDESGQRYSPAVRRIASERGIDLNLVQGSGRHGRITRKDVENYDPSQVQAEVTMHDQVAMMPPEITRQVSATQTTPQPDLQSVSQPAATTSPESVSLSGNTRVEKADPVRKAIAKKMTQSYSEIPHAWMMIEVDVSNIVRLRNDHKDAFREREGISLSFFPFFVKAIVQAVKKHPVVNTSWDDGNIIYHQDINTSIAVGTEEQLFVPVIKGADQYSLTGLAKEINRIAQGARQGTLTNDDMSGGTITINNTGVFGSVQSMGIINHPQAMIIQVESINKRMVPTDDSGFKFADIVNICVSMDHRILDGMAVGKFLKDVKENLQRFSHESDIY